MSQEFWRDPNMDAMINDIVEIFTQVEGVQLVRLSGLLKREQNILPDLTSEILNNIIKKLRAAEVIQYKFMTNCPHCQEISYQLAEIDISKAKMCDTCSTFYNLINGVTLNE